MCHIPHHCVSIIILWFTTPYSHNKYIAAYALRSSQTQTCPHIPHKVLLLFKPDMSPTERKCESMLLREGWSLIQSGVPRAVIKIRGSRLLVRNKLYDQVSLSGNNLLFSHHNSSNSVVKNNAVHVSSPIVPTPSFPTPQLSQPQAVTSQVSMSANGYSACQSSAQPLESSPTHPPHHSCL